MARAWYGLVIHHTAGHQTDTVKSERAMHKRMGWRDIGYHFFVEVDDNGRGHLKRGRSTELPGCHGDEHANSTMLGLAIAGNYSNIVLNGDLYEDVLAAVLHVCKLYGIAADKIKGHKEVNPTQCPGILFPLSALKADVSDRLKVKAKAKGK